MTESVKAPLKLLVKLTEITQSVKRIPKNGVNKFHGYKYMTESDIKEVVREEMASRKVIMYGDEIANERIEVTTKKGGVESQIKLTKQMFVVDAESGESITFKATGVGQDAGDKAQYKAETGLIKYVLNNLFLIPSGDDPEKDGQALQPPKKLDSVQLTVAKGKLNEFSEIQGLPSNEAYEKIADYLRINSDIDSLNENEFGTLLNYFNKMMNSQQKQKKRAWDK